MMLARQMLIKIVLPGLILATVYILFVAGDLIRTETSLRRDLERADRDAERAAGFATLDARVRGAEVGLRDDQRRQQAVRAEAEELCAGMCTELPRTELIRELAALFARHRLVLRKEHPPTSSVELPASLEVVERWLAQTGKPAPELWEFALSGGFQAMQRALAELAAMHLHILPVHLDMQPASDEGPGLRWRLVVWL